MKDIKNQCYNDIIWEEYEGKILTLAEKIAFDQNREGNRRLYEMEKELRDAYEEIERLKQKVWDLRGEAPVVISRGEAYSILE